MIETIKFIGAGFCAVVSFGLPICCLIYCLKRGDRRNNLMLLAISALAAVASSYIIGIPLSLIPLETIKGQSLFLYALVYAVVVGIADSLIRLLSVNYGKKTGYGFSSCFALGTGYAIGQVFFSATNYIQVIYMMSLIKSGTFVDTMVEQVRASLDTALTEAEVAAEIATATEEAIEYQQSMIDMSNLTLFVDGISQASVVILQFILIYVIILFVKKGKMWIGAAAAAGIYGVITLVQLLISLGHGADSGAIISTDVAMALYMILYLAVIVIGVLFVLSLKKQFPEEKAAQPFMTGKQQKKLQEQEQNKKTLREIQQSMARKKDEEQ